MSAASLAVVVTSGERSRRKGRHGVVCRYNCVIHARALCVYLGAKRHYINTLLFLPFLTNNNVLSSKVAASSRNCIEESFSFACQSPPS